MAHDAVPSSFPCLCHAQVVDVSTLTPLSTHFFRTMLTHLLTTTSEDDLLAVLKRTCALKDPRQVRETLSILLHKHVVQSGQVDDKVKKRAKSVVKLLDKLTASDSSKGGEDDMMMDMPAGR